jgi:hypothetical protein
MEPGAVSDIGGTFVAPRFRNSVRRIAAAGDRRAWARDPSLEEVAPEVAPQAARRSWPSLSRRRTSPSVEQLVDLHARIAPRMIVRMVNASESFSDR